MNHVIGPLSISKNERVKIERNKFLLEVDPLKHTEWTINTFMTEMQKIKRQVGVKSFIEFRRARARVAASRQPIDKVAKLLGHKSGSTSTARYMQKLDSYEMHQRLKMTE